MVDYPLYQSHCLGTNKYLLPGFPLMLLAHIHIKTPHPNVTKIPPREHFDHKQNIFFLLICVVYSIYLIISITPQYLLLQHYID